MQGDMSEYCAKLDHGGDAQLSGDFVVALGTPPDAGGAALATWPQRTFDVGVGRQQLGRARKQTRPCET
jgi:hypothetical protein